MRFSIVSILTAALAGSAMASPVQSRSLITDLGHLVSGLGRELGLTDLENRLKNLLGDALPKLEAELGITFAEKLLGLSDHGAPAGTIQAIGDAVVMLLDGADLDTVDEYLNDKTNGAVHSLEEALGIDDVKEALGLE